MTATTAERLTQRRNGDQFSFPVAAATQLLVGTIIVLNASGYAEAGATATGKMAVGVCEETADNTAGSAGDIDVAIRRGTFKFFNSASADLIANSDYGATCYIVDNQTVAKTDALGTRSIAGTIRGVDPADGGVWVQF